MTDSATLAYYRSGSVDAFLSVALHCATHPEETVIPQGVASAAEIAGSLRRAVLREKPRVMIFGVDLSEYDFHAIAAYGDHTIAVLNFTSFQTAGMRPGAGAPVSKIQGANGRVVYGAGSVSGTYLACLREECPEAAGLINDQVVRCVHEHALGVAPVSAVAGATVAALASYPESVYHWRGLLLSHGDSEGFARRLLEGSAIERYLNSQVSRLAARASPAHRAFGLGKALYGQAVNVSAPLSGLVAPAIPSVDYDHEFGMDWYVDRQLAHCKVHTRSARIVDVIRAYVPTAHATSNLISFYVPRDELFTHWI